jgi:transcriptional regulator with XRE-family HTH domain
LSQLARRASVPASTLRGWEADRGFPGGPTIMRLAAALGVPAEQLAEGVDDPAGEEGEADAERLTETLGPPAPPKRPRRRRPKK